MGCHRVVILAGGKGTRLRPFTASFPKPLMPIGEMPILAILLHQLIHQRFRNVTLTLGHLSELIRAYICQHKKISKAINIDFVDEDMPTGTAGSLARVDDLTDTFLVMNGDVLTNLDFNELIRAHKRSGAVLTIAGHAKQTKIDLGVLEVDQNGELRSYVEKPEHRFNVSMGIYVYEPCVLRFIEHDTYLDFPTLVHKLLGVGAPIHVHRNNAFWLDIGRPEDYAQAQEVFETQPECFGLARPGKYTANEQLQRPSLTAERGKSHPRLNA